jgi:hypothetical protein
MDAGENSKCQRFVNLLHFFLHDPWIPFPQRLNILLMGRLLVDCIFTICRLIASAVNPYREDLIVSVVIM